MLSNLPSETRELPYMFPLATLVTNGLHNVIKDQYGFA